MKRLRAFFLRLAGVLPSERREREFAAEIDGHLQMHIDDNLRAGMSAVEARRRAILTLGGVEVTKQAYREQSTVPLLETFMQDLRFVARQLRKNLGFTCAAVLILGLGMCASIAIFAFVDAALIKPLPYADSARLVNVTESVAMFPRANLSYQDYVDWKKMNNVFNAMEAYTGSGYTLKTQTGVELVQGVRVTDGFFKILGVKPALGRDFYTGEDLPSAPKAVMLTYSAWKNRYGGRKGVIGQAVTLSDAPYTIVGVLPESFQFASRSAEFWSTLNTHTSCELRRSCHNLNGIGRLKDGVSVEAALANMTAIAQQLERQYPDSNRGQGASVVALSEVMVGDVRPILLTLLGGAGPLLLIACVNVASLLLVRSESRRREIAVRGALGASPARLRRQFVTEGVLLVAIGSVIGVTTAFGAMQLLLRLLNKDMLASMPYLAGLGLNYRVLAFAGCVAVLAVVVFSVTPILRLSNSKLREDLNEGARGSGGTLWRRLGSNLVHRIDPGIATMGESTMAISIADSPTAYMHRSSAWLIGGFAALALLLSVVGLYGVIAYSVSQRTREIGVRMALGAQRGSVYGLVMREAGRLTGMGVVLGSLCAVGAATLMRKLLFGTAAWDAATLGAVAAMLGVSALLASFIPAHRAASVNPVDALRAE